MGGALASVLTLVEIVRPTAESGILCSMKLGMEQIRDNKRARRAKVLLFLLFLPSLFSFASHLQTWLRSHFFSFGA